VKGDGACCGCGVKGEVGACCGCGVKGEVAGKNGEGWDGANGEGVEPGNGVDCCAGCEKIDGAAKGLNGLALLLLVFAALALTWGKLNGVPLPLEYGFMLSLANGL